jgi:hypothetical protein
MSENGAIYNVEKCGGARGATNDVTIWRIHVACWLSKATRARSCTHPGTCTHPHTHTNMSYLLLFHARNDSPTRLNVTLYAHRLSFSQAHQAAGCHLCRLYIRRHSTFPRGRQVFVLGCTWTLLTGGETTRGGHMYSQMKQQLWSPYQETTSFRHLS